MEHTPTPWTANGDFILHTSTGTHIATTMPAELPVTPQSVANAEYIVLACNAHADLLAACIRAEHVLDSIPPEILVPPWDSWTVQVLAELQAALATPPVEPEKESTYP